MFKKIGIVFLLIFFLFLGYQIANAEVIPEENSSAETNAVGYEQIKNIKKIIGEKTPDFLAKPIIAVVNALEEFRKNSFNSQLVFYSVFFFFFFLIARFIWRLIFSLEFLSKACTISIMILRIFLSFILLLSILFMPFWVSALLALAGMIYFSFFVEAIFLFFLSDLLYGVEEIRFSYMVFFSFVTSILFLVVLEFLKRKIRFIPDIIIK